MSRQIKEGENLPLYGELIPVIEKVFPDVFHQFVENIDDVHSGFDFSPEPFEIIRVQFSQTEPDYRIEIIRLSISRGWDNVLKRRTIFLGDIPGDNTHQPDMKFIETILKNYKSFPA